MSLVCDLGEKTQNIKEGLIGSKAFNLLKLRENGVSVPAGFILTASLYKERDKINLEEILSKYLGGLKSNYLMVRSSAVGEDGIEHSFAGQLDSFQVSNNVKDVLSGVHKCWESIGNSRVLTYSESSKIDLKEMAVIVQEMIEPEFSGVLFTDAPDSPGKKLIEYVAGHCEKLVSGEVTPTSIYLPTTDYQNDFTKKLDKISDDIFSIYNTHQDIEWAYQNEKIYIVQSRPITHQSRRISWSSTNVNENYPEKLSPLLYSVARRSYYHYFYNLCEDFRIRIPFEERGYYYNIIGTWGEKMYYNMSAIHQIIALTPFKGLLSKSFDNFVGYQKEFKILKKENQLKSKIKFIYSTIEKYISLDSYVERIENRVTEYVKKDSNLSLFALFHEFLELRFNTWRYAACADFFAMITHGALGKFLQYIHFSESMGLQNKLVQSIPDLISNKPIFELWNLKKYIEKQEYTDLFTKQSADEIWKILNSENEHEEILIKINRYLNDWGFRCSGELMLFTENYSENPLLLIEMLKAFITSHEQQGPEYLFDIKHKEQVQTLKKTCAEVIDMHGILKGMIYTIILKRLVKATMFSISSRERVRLKQAHMYFQFKKVCLSIEKSLRAKGILNHEKDIFFLEYDEISRILNEEYIDKDYLQELIKIRKIRFEKVDEYPENFHGDNSNFLNAYYDQDIIEGEQVEGTYKGLPACGGVITGRIVVLESVTQINQIKKGDILVTKQTDPGWICAFPLISGLIVERGGMLSHGAIVAREFGIPAIVGIKSITTILQTGDMVLLDGNKGIVECQK